MKLIRFGEVGSEKIGVQIDSVNYDVSAFGGDYDEGFFEGGGLDRLKKYVEENKGSLKKVPSDVRLASPIARPSKLVCIGLNYKDHAEETGAKIPKEPIIFMKSTTSIVGPNDSIMIPRGSTKTDWEVEVRVVIGKKARYVTESEAMDNVAGYVLHNEVSEREYQLERGGTWDKGKGCDTFAPLGPVMTLKEDVQDVNNLNIWLKVNGKTYQNGNTKNLIFSIAHVVSYLSEFMTLLPGDVISTGTPAGVGLGFNPPIYLKPGDVVELGADELGVSKQEVIAFKK